MKRIVPILFATIFAVPALADDLPGVDQPKQIVQPLPEPIDEQSTGDRDAIKVGDWDVKVSGSIIVDIGVGDIKPPRR